MKSFFLVLIFLLVTILVGNSENYTDVGSLFANSDIKNTNINTSAKISRKDSGIQLISIKDRDFNSGYIPMPFDILDGMQLVFKLKDWPNNYRARLTFSQAFESVEISPKGLSSYGWVGSELSINFDFYSVERVTLTCKVKEGLNISIVVVK